jgi:hypothetical protein
MKKSKISKRKKINETNTITFGIFLCTSNFFFKHPLVIKLINVYIFLFLDSLTNLLRILLLIIIKIFILYNQCINTYIYICYYTIKRYIYLRK